MNEEEIKQQLRRSATKLTPGGFRPTDEDTESWLGKVFLFAPEEDVPTDHAGSEMCPFAQLYLPGLSVSDQSLGDTLLITLFISNELPERFEPMGKNWVIREYTSMDNLERRDIDYPQSSLKPFPLKTVVVDEDYPLWDRGGVPFELEEVIVELEDSGQIRNYYDFTSHCRDHKFGGYPSFCQSGANPGDDFKFIFQISSDEKIKLNVFDGGSLMFWKNVKTDEWAIYYDFY